MCGSDSHTQGGRHAVTAGIGRGGDCTPRIRCQASPKRIWRPNNLAGQPRLTDRHQWSPNRVVPMWIFVRRRSMISPVP
jgi:hypothetical protein